MRVPHLRKYILGSKLLAFSVDTSRSPPNKVPTIGLGPLRTQEKGNPSFGGYAMTNETALLAPSWIVQGILLAHLGLSARGLARNAHLHPRATRGMSDRGDILGYSRQGEAHSKNCVLEKLSSSTQYGPSQPSPGLPTHPLPANTQMSKAAEVD